MRSKKSQRKYQRYDDFRQAIQSADYGPARRRPQAKVKDRAEFELQKRYVISLHESADVVHSFVDDNGQIFDCVPIGQQPALRRSGAPLAHPPDVPGLPAADKQPNLIAPFGSGRTDRFGDEMTCPTGTVPIRRVTLKELNRFATLNDYLRKPRISRRKSKPTAADVVGASPHPHSYAYQDVQNLGGHTIMTVWQPTVTGSQVFSLSQLWCVGVNGGDTQTVEAGWQVYPAMYGHGKPTLFAYWSRNNYQQGSYDYNTFVQYGATHALGMSFQSVSVVGGPEVDLELCFILQQGNWWLFLSGIDQQHVIGYFPASIFAGGALAAGATRIEFGGETAGNGSFPPMGSGAFAVAGAGEAASHRSLHYFSAAGMVPMAPITVQEWPAAYTIQLVEQAGTDPYFFFGGPGSAGLQTN